MSAKTITKRMLKNARKLKVLQDKAEAGTITPNEALVLAALLPKTEAKQAETKQAEAKVSESVEAVAQTS